MKRNLFAGFMMLLIGASTHAAGGLESVVSAHDVGTTMQRLEDRLNGADFRIFAKVDHGAGAQSVGMALPPTQLLIFGKPKGGTALMQSARTVGIDLPLKYLVWEDADGKVQVSWNAPAWVAKRHGITDKAKVVNTVQGALRKFATEAAKP